MISTLRIPMTLSTGKCVECHVLIFTNLVYLGMKNIAKGMKEIEIGTKSPKKAQGKT